MKKLVIVMLSVFALMLVGCSNPANSGPTSDPYLLGLDNCEVTKNAIEDVVQDDWEYDCTLFICSPGIEPETSQWGSNGYALKCALSDPLDTDFKYYANANFSTVVIKSKEYMTDKYQQYIKK